MLVHSRINLLEPQATTRSFLSAPVRVTGHLQSIFAIKSSSIQTLITKSSFFTANGVQLLSDLPSDWPQTLAQLNEYHEFCAKIKIEVQIGCKLIATENRDGSPP